MYTHSTFIFDITVGLIMICKQSKCLNTGQIHKRLNPIARCDYQHVVISIAWKTKHTYEYYTEVHKIRFLSHFNIYNPL